MAENDTDPQKTGTETPVPAPAPVVPPATTLDLGDGNLLNKDQAIEMRTAKVGLEQEKQTLLGQVDSLTQAGTKKDADLATANQGRIAAEAATQTANARATEAEGKAANYVAPGDYEKLKTQVGTQEWTSLVERVTRMTTQYNIPQEKLFGKDAAALDSIEEGLKLGGGNAKGAPVLGAKGGSLGEANTQTPFNSAIEKNMETLRRIRDGDKTAGLLG